MSSSSGSGFAHHVFLSRGDDTRWTFSDHLYAALLGSGFRTFRVEERDGSLIDSDLERETLEREIKGSRSSVIVFSRGFVGSKRCLDEMAMILDLMKKRVDSGRAGVVLPVFYDLDPSEVRKQTGVVGEALAKHEGGYEAEGDESEKMNGWGKRMERWKEALREVADLAGLVLQNQADGHEAKFIKIIVEQIADKLDRTVLSVTPYPTGIDSRVKDINEWIQDGSTHINVMVIHGMGGIGKTTIAKIAYNQNFDQFEGSSFIANIREASKQPNGLIRLQKQLISNILKRRKERINNVDEGIIKIKDSICCKRVLIVLDDVDELDQLNAIFGMREWFHPGSKIIITTREERIVKGHEACEMYKVKELNEGEALSLFCRHAFGKSQPIETYIEQSKRAVFYCNGLPLALEILGCSLSDASVDVWDSALGKLQAFSNVKIQNVLQISYDCLDDHDKDLFLDIVCFFVWKDKDYMVKILDGCDFHAIAGLQNLIRRSLVQINEVDHKTLMMHQLLREMGWEVIRGESPKEPGRRSRVWHHKDAFDVLKEKTGTGTVEGLVLDLDARKEYLRAKNVVTYDEEQDQHHEEVFLHGILFKRRRVGLFSKLPINIKPFLGSEEADFETCAFSRMQNMRILQLYDVCLSGGYDKFPKNLRWLCWRGYPLTSIPSDFPLENVVVLDFPYSKLRLFCKGNKLLSNVKILNLTRSRDLTSSPDFSKLPNLETLILKDCTKLTEVHESIVELERLVVLNLKGCKNLRNLPSKISQLSSLEKLILSGCSKLHELPTNISKMEHLKVFEADGVNLSPSPSSAEAKSWKGAVQPWLSQPSKRHDFSVSTLPRHVAWLSLEACNITDDIFPKDLSGMPLLQGLRLSRNPIRSLPASIKGLSSLMELDLQRCTKLRAIPELPMSLQRICIYGCRALERAENLPNLLSSLELSSAECAKLDQVKGLFKLESIGKYEKEVIRSLGLCEQVNLMGDLDMKLFNNLTYTSRRVQAPQGLDECGIHSVFLPGSAVPGWLSSKTTGSSTSFDVPNNQTVLGFKICICYTLSVNSRKANWRYEYIQIINNTKGLKWTYRPAFVGVAEREGKDILWLSDWEMIGDQLMGGGDEVTVTVNMEESFEVKEFGIWINGVTQDSNSIKDSRNGIDLSVYRMRAGDYFLCNHEEYARSLHHSKISGLSSVQPCLCGFQCDCLPMK